MSKLFVLLPILLNGQGHGDGGADLVLDEFNMQQSMYVATETYTRDSCEVNECLMHLKNGQYTFPATRKLLRFDTRAVNIGTSDFNLGSPYEPTNANFVYDPCHQHYHFEDFAEYKVYSVSDVDEVSNLVPETGKRAFCLMDSAPAPSSLYNGPRRNHEQFNCDTQGISVGWQDIYGANLDCQFVDITELPDGDYKLVVILNPVGVLNERNRGNNRATLHFTVGNGATMPGDSNCHVAREDWLGDGYCDKHGGYNTPECNYDRGDCCLDCCRDTADFTCGVNGYECTDPNCEILETPIMSEIQCQIENPGWIGDGYCDDGDYNTQRCGWDGGDCCRQSCVASDYTCGEGGYNCLDPGYTN